MGDHPHIAKLYETFEDEKVVTLIMEACNGGEVYEIIGESAGTSEVDAWQMMNQMLAGLAYMHDTKNIAHRDLKPENILIKEKGNSLADSHLKIIDFGFATKFQPGQQSMSTRCGTPHYLAPEIFQGPYNETCDIWSSGCILYLFLCGSPPFDGEEPEQIMEKAKNEQPDFSSDHWHQVSPLAKGLVRFMLHKQPAKRPSAHSILKDNDWMKKERQEVESQLTAQSPSRHTRSAAEIKANILKFKQMNAFTKQAMETVAHVMDEDDVATLRNTFEALDKEGDGKLTIEQLVDACGDSKLPREQAEKMAKDLDIDGNGFVSYCEFISANLAGSRKKAYLKEAYCWEAFRIFDKNGDGKIEVCDLEQMMAEDRLGSLTQANVKLSPADIKQMMEEFDSNHDGCIDFDEFFAMLKKQSSS